MLKRVIPAGLLGWVVLMVWVFVVNGMFGFRRSIDMNRVAGEKQVYALLKEKIVEPGRYIFNPEVSRERGFPGEEPVYSVHYSGMGHGTAGMMMLIDLLIGIVSVTLAAWMLSVTSARILSSYPRKVLFFAAIGLLFALFGDLTRFGIGGYSLKPALLLALNSVVAWTLVGLVVAWRIKPGVSVAPAGGMWSVNMEVTGRLPCHSESRFIGVRNLTSMEGASGQVRFFACAQNDKPHVAPGSDSISLPGPERRARECAP